MNITMKTLLSTIIICLLRKSGHVGAPRPETKNTGQGDIQSKPSVSINDLF